MAYTSNDKIRSGGIWSFVQNGGNQIIGFLLGIVLARLLMPEDFGMMAMVMVFIGFAGFLQQFGFNQALIQNQKVDTTDYSTVFWFNTGTGIILFGLFFFGSEVVARIYDNGTLDGLTKYLAFNFLFNALSSVQGTILTKQFAFKKLAIINLSSNLIMYVVAIPMAIMDFGVISLVWGGIMQNLSKAIALWISSNWKPVLVFSKTSFKKLFKFGIFVFLQTPLGYISRNVDTFMIGKLAGDASLGLYNKAYQIMLLPLNNISNSFKQVMFPAMSEAQKDRERLQMLFLRSTRIVAFISFPIMFGLWSVAEPFILGVYGINWGGTIPLLKVLVFVGAFQSLITFVGTGYYALGKPQIQLYLDIITTPILIAVFYFGYIFSGLLGVVWFYFIFTLIVGSVALGILFHLFKLPANVFLLNLAPVFLTSVFMALVVKGFSFLPLLIALPQIAQLLLLAFLGAFTYLALNMAFKIEAFFDFANQIQAIKKLPLLRWYFRNYGK
ncbi:MAG: lipopolysaccharide biosynthesis protein [Salinivirgaceae bacterium]